jgi:hypothetical protein
VNLGLVIFFEVFGALGVVSGAWPLATGRNLPGALGRGFTRGDNLRLQRAPAIYFHWMGATIAMSGLFCICFGAFIGLSPGRSTSDLAVVDIVVAVAAIAFCISLAWTLVLTHRHKLFRWNAP